MLPPVCLSCLVIGALAAGCASGGGEKAPVTVVATTTTVGDLTHQVGGGRVAVRTILRPNADPHEYEPRPSDARALEGADLVVRSGGDLDGWLGDVIKSAGSDAPQLKLIDHLRARGNDPHWWQDPTNTIEAVLAIRDELGRIDPAGRAGYRERAARYVARLRRLDSGIAACLRQVPVESRKLVTTHDSLGYFSARYGVPIVGSVLPSLSTQAQPSARDTEQLVRRLRAQHVRAVFPESALNPRLERAVAREAGTRVGGKLWADALGPPRSDGATYLQAEESNTQVLVQGMSGGRSSCRPRA